MTPPLAEIADAPAFPSPPTPAPGDDERITWWYLLEAIARCWRVFVVVATVGLALAVAVHDTGAEYVAVAEVLAVAPPSRNSLVDSARRHYDSIAGIVQVQLESDEYHRRVFPDGSDGTVTVDSTSAWPVVRLQVRADSWPAAVEVIQTVADDFVAIVDRQQEIRDVAPVARLRAHVGAVYLPPPRPPGSRRALVALVGAAVFVAGAVAYAADRLRWWWGRRP